MVGLGAAVAQQQVPAVLTDLTVPAVVALKQRKTSVRKRGEIQCVVVLTLKHHTSVDFAKG